MKTGNEIYTKRQSFNCNQFFTNEQEFTFICHTSLEDINHYAAFVQQRFSVRKYLLRGCFYQNNN